MAIKFKFFFSNNCYNELLKLIGDVLPNFNKVSKDTYHSKKNLSRGSIWIMRRLMSAKIVISFLEGTQGIKQILEMW
jgi:hypothetical protein